MPGLNRPKKFTANKRKHAAKDGTLDTLNGKKSIKPVFESFPPSSAMPKPPSPADAHMIDAVVDANVTAFKSSTVASRDHEMPDAHPENLKTPESPADSDPAYVLHQLNSMHVEKQQPEDPADQELIRKVTTLPSHANLATHLRGNDGTKLIEELEAKPHLIKLLQAKYLQDAKNVILLALVHCEKDENKGKSKTKVAKTRRTKDSYHIFNVNNHKGWIDLTLGTKGARIAQLRLYEAITGTTPTEAELQYSDKMWANAADAYAKYKAGAALKARASATSAKTLLLPVRSRV